MRTVTYLTAPIKMGLYGCEIIDYADSCICVPVTDLGLTIEHITVDVDNSADAVKIANKIMFDSNKGKTFVEIGVIW